MYCPQCGAEFKDGIDECCDCNVALVGEAPPEPVPERVDFVTVFKADNETALVLAKSLLEGTGIRYFVDGERLRNWFGIRRFGTGYNVLVGPAELQVERDREQEARELLAHLEEEKLDSEPD